MPGAGLEPARPEGHPILSPSLSLAPKVAPARSGSPPSGERTLAQSSEPLGNTGQPSVPAPNEG